VVAFPNVPRGAFAASPVGESGDHADLLVFREDLAPEPLCDRLRGAALAATRRSRCRLPAPANAIRALECAIGPIPRRPILSAQSEAPPGSLREELDRLLASSFLEPDQRRLAIRDLRGAPHLVRGVAGSGKSLVLVQNLVSAVNRVAGAQGRLRILVTCFNKKLVPHLRDRALATAAQYGIDLDRAEVRFLDFGAVLREVAKAAGVEVPRLGKGDGDDPRVERISTLLRRLEDACQQQSSLTEDLAHELVYVDESQDLVPEELVFLHRLARPDPTTGERGIALFYDDAQNVYGRRRPVWRSLGLNVLGRTFYMTECRRTTRPIVTLALNVLLGTALPEGERAGTRGFADVSELLARGLALATPAGLQIAFTPRPGDLPELRTHPTRGELEVDLVNTVRDLMARETVRPEEILIQAKTREQVRSLHAALKAAPGIPAVHIGSGEAERHTLLAREGSIAVSTIHSAKGYDAPVVVLAHAESFQAEPRDRASFYVGATRAQARLVVLGVESEAGGSLLDEIGEVRRRLPILLTGPVLA
jgi:hypothetical protein